MFDAGKTRMIAPDFVVLDYRSFSVYEYSVKCIISTPYTVILFYVQKCVNKSD